jgi:hypothetical protein
MTWWGVAVFLWVIVFVFATHQPEVRIVEIETTIGSQVVDSAMREEVRSLLGRKFLLFGRRDNQFLFQRTYAIEVLLDKFPDIVAITIKYPDIHTISVSITERSMTAQWCIEDPDHRFKEACYAVDQFGEAYRDAPYYSDDLIVKFYVDTLPDTSEIPLSVLTIEEMESFLILKEMLAKTGLHVRGARYPKENEEGVGLIIDRVAKSNLEQDILFWLPYNMFARRSGHNQFSRIFSTLLREGPLSSQVLAEESGLEYIDLRFGNNVYYKFTNQDQITFSEDSEEEDQ